MTTEAQSMLLRAERPIPSIAVARRSPWALLRYVPNPKTTPFTFGYLVVLLATTLLLEFADPAVTDRLLQLSSTDAHNLWRRPLTSLLSSAIWVPGESWLIYALIFAIAVAPLERRFGARRTALVFFSGHIVATLATELPVMALISAHVLPNSAGHWLDIGVSYGFFTTAGSLVFLLRGRARPLALAAMEAFIAAVWLSDDPAALDSVVTLLGHAFAAHFGLLVCGPWLRERIRRPSPDFAG
ncbi:rhomboid-like protein [Amycolatopsis sp. CA-126428]|uniref:rhomboid-like protein n=1 Tax=Amycolatopsis sp. CA-126428 TaxID=2073158 RepID=UPI001E506F7E|nr:rhomboid-like protein [Amycolatopsis sp. CA-126428]